MPCEDIDECKITETDADGNEVEFDRVHNDDNKCHFFATCYNLPGAYECRCKAGYRGDGYHCEVKNFCAISDCGPNGRCETSALGHNCYCDNGKGLWCHWYDVTLLDFYYELWKDILMN